MGSFMGHVLPGTFFILFSIWWCFNVFSRYFKRRGSDKYSTTYRNRTWFQCSCAPNIPLEPFLKVTACFIGLCGELYTALDKDWNFVNLGNGQHMTMFFSFGLNGFVEVLMFYGVSLPPNMDYASSILAFAIEGLLFYFHLHGRPHMDVQIHMFLFYTIVGCAISCALEMKHKQEVLMGLSRAYFTLLQGVWFYQIAFILYAPKCTKIHWDLENHNQMMLVTMMFAWTCTGTFIFVLIVGNIVRIYGKFSTNHANESTIEFSPLMDEDLNINVKVNSSSFSCHQDTLLSDSDKV